MGWNISVEEALFLGGLEKGPFLKEFEPDFFFDDQTRHCHRQRLLARSAMSLAALPTNWQFRLNSITPSHYGPSKMMGQVTGGNEKRPGKGRRSRCPGGEGGIRTRVGVLPQTRFPGVRLKPLIHLSVSRRGCRPGARASLAQALARGANFSSPELAMHP